jgi:hypothetical protein
MGADISRERFSPGKDFCGVLMQQGRVQLDADWNELVAILDRRRRAETADIVGRCVVPRTTPQGFKIVAAGGMVTIGPGRIYVDGLLAENHGQAPPEFDVLLGELHGTAPVSYDQQPYFPGAPDLPGKGLTGGPYLVYLDVWEREVTYLEDPGLVEIALGVDTTARLQTVWQVKVLQPAVGSGVDCATPDDQIPGWADVIRPSAGRLTTSAVSVPSPTDPCLLPPQGGYRGLENRLYRVEIHDVAASGAATFKWSRDNASVATTVTALNTGRDQLTVARTRRDADLRFSNLDWVEVIDDVLEFSGKPGILAQVKDVNDDTLTVTLTTPLPGGGLFPTDANGKVDPERHTRLRRWDQKGKVFDANGQPIVDLDAPGSTGSIPIPSAPTTIALEDGVQIAFSTDPAGGRCRIGDYWVFAARSADASVEPLDKAAPREIHHHYGRLALVTFPSTVSDCRIFWPPEGGGAGCDCSVCVNADAHNKGTLTIQQALDRVKDTGGRVCLEPGTYRIGPAPLRIRGARAVRLSGHGTATVLLSSGSGPAVTVDNSWEVTLEDFQLSLPPPVQTTAGSPGSVGLLLSHSFSVTLQRCEFVELSTSGAAAGTGVAVGLAGYLFQTVIRECFLYAGIGIANLAAPPPQREAPVKLPPYLLVVDLTVQDNLFACNRTAVRLDGFTIHSDQTRIAGNVITTAVAAGLILTGAVIAGASVDLEGNQVAAGTDGIRCGTGDTRVCNNDVGPGATQPGGNGIVLTTGLDRSGLARCQVLGNRIRGVSGHGISIQTHVVSAIIKQNCLEELGGGGIVMEDSSSADVLSIANNQMLHVGIQPGKGDRPVAGVQLLQAVQVEVASNTLRGVCTTPTGVGLRVGILVVAPVTSADTSGAASTVRIAGNLVTDVGAPAGFDGTGYGIGVLGPFDQLEVVENVVRRASGPTPKQSSSRWMALVVQPITDDALQMPGVAFLNMDTAMVGFFGRRFLRLRLGQENVAVRGNRLQAYGRMPAVSIQVRGSTLFTDNHCVLEVR